MTENPLVEQAKQGDVNAIASLMNRLLKSQGMLANVERLGDRLEILIESDLRSLDDEMRIPKRPVLVGMIKKWFVTIEVKTVSSLKISWQQTGFEEPAWTEEIFLVQQESQPTQDNNFNEISEQHLSDVLGNGGLSEAKPKLTIPPLPVLPRQAMPEPSRPEPSSDRINSGRLTTSPDLDDMFGETNVSESLQSISVPEYLSSDLENTQFAQESDELWINDASHSDHSEMVDTGIGREFGNAIDDEISGETDGVQTEEISPSASPLEKILFQTPSLPIQFAQYVVVCVVILLALRGIHGVLGTTKAPKTTSAISTQIK